MDFEPGGNDSSCSPLIFSLGQIRLEGDIVPLMVSQPEAAIAKPGPKHAVRADGRERRWPRFWTLFGALAASAALWVVIYFAATVAATLISGALR
jgi:hypothetical protein